MDASQHELHCWGASMSIIANVVLQMKVQGNNNSEGMRAVDF
jgi:hypothetical protein